MGATIPRRDSRVPADHEPSLGKTSNLFADPIRSMGNIDVRILLLQPCDRLGIGIAVGLMNPFSSRKERCFDCTPVEQSIHCRPVFRSIEGFVYHPRQNPRECGPQAFSLYASFQVIKGKTRGSLISPAYTNNVDAALNKSGARMEISQSRTAQDYYPVAPISGALGGHRFHIGVRIEF